MNDNQEKLNEQLFNVINNDCDSVETRLKKVKYLVRLGADVNAKNKNGFTPLMGAVERGEVELVKELIKNGAIAFSNDGKPVANQEVLAKALKTSELIISHAEILELKGTPESEYKAVAQEIETLRKTGGKYHFAHISTKESIELIRQAKNRIINIFIIFS